MWRPVPPVAVPRDYRGPASDEQAKHGDSVLTVLIASALDALLANPEVDRAELIHMEYVWPAKIFLIAAVDLSSDDLESVVEGRLMEIEQRLSRKPTIQRAVLTLMAPPA